MTKNILITGSTGFLGKEVVKKFLEHTDYNLYILTRNKQGLSYNLRIPIETFDMDRVFFMEGDITQKGIVKDSDKQTLKNTIDEVVHMAASVDFQESKRKEIFKTNVDGTKNLLELVKSFKKLNMLNHVSTCFVCGKLTYPNSFSEEDNYPDLGFKNPYEESKRMCEEIVKKSGIPHSVLRPSIIIGSSNGANYDEKTIYALFSAVLTAKASLMKSEGVKEEEMYGKIREYFVMKSPLIGKYETLKNMIPVDVASKMIVEIVSKNKEYKTFQIAYPKMSKVGEIVRGVTNFLNIEGIYLEEREHIDKTSLSRYGRFLVNALEPYADYMSVSDPVFRMDNTTQIVGKEYLNNLPTPDINFFSNLYEQFFNSHWKPKLKPKAIKKQNK